MQVIPLCALNTVEELEHLLHSGKKVRLYGAGYYLSLFLQEIRNFDPKYTEIINCIMVADADDNPAKIGEIPVIAYQKANLKAGEAVLLTLGKRYTEEVYYSLKNTGVAVYEVNFDMFQKKPYQDVKQSIQPFIDGFPENGSGMSKPVPDYGIKAWTCWWQGEEQTPELVKACWESQRRNLPSDVELIIITKDNYKQYISLPEYIIKKVEIGSITLVTLSDVFRVTLLYKYGGFWLDSTLLVCRPLDKDIMDYAIYTRNLPETQYCTRVMWADWFMYAKPGNKLFQFLSEGFFYFFSVYDRIQYYFTIDYMIAIACNMFPEVERQMKAIPYNNEKALELEKHLTEKFNKNHVERYIADTFVQKLTYKLNWSSTSEKENTVYEYLLEKYKS